MRFLGNLRKIYPECHLFPAGRYWRVIGVVAFSPVVDYAFNSTAPHLAVHRFYLYGHSVTD